jgi:hypothetical protein
MSGYTVVLAVGRAAVLDIGRRITMQVIAPSRLDAAVFAERLADSALSDVEYAHAKQVTEIPHRAPAALALAA